MLRLDDQGGPQPPKPWTEPPKENEKKETPPQDKKEDKQ